MTSTLALPTALVLTLTLTLLGASAPVPTRTASTGGSPSAVVATSAPVGHAATVPAPAAAVPPVSPLRVIAPFDPPEQRWLAGHRGVDLAATAGADVTAPVDATVAFAGRVAGRGVLVLRHDDGLLSSFEPVDALMAEGARVTRGQTVASVASTPGHCAPAACLHWGLRRDEVYLDPMVLLHPEPVVLLPG